MTRRWAGRSSTDMGLTDASKAEAVANSVNAFSRARCRWWERFLPDIDRFTAISSIESGIIVSATT
jgi:hypothetical protein